MRKTAIGLLIAAVLSHLIGMSVDNYVSLFMGDDREYLAITLAREHAAWDFRAIILILLAGVALMMTPKPLVGKHGF